MREQTVAMYCLLDDYCQARRWPGQRPVDRRRQLSDAQVLTVALVAARFFGGRFHLAQQYLEQHWGFAHLDKSGLSRHLHRLADELHALLATLGHVFKHASPSLRYVIDSFPVPVCLMTRSARCRLLQGTAYHGRCASKRLWFYGLKVQVVLTAEGVPVDYYLHAGAENDVTGLKALNPELPAGSVLYADAGYTSYAWEDAYQAHSGVRLLVARKRGSKRPHSPAQAFLLQHERKQIETEISVLTDRMPKRIHAVSPQGFALKIVLFIAAHLFYKIGA